MLKFVGAYVVLRGRGLFYARTSCCLGVSWYWYVLCCLQLLEAPSQSSAAHQLLVAYSDIGTLLARTLH